MSFLSQDELRQLGLKSVGTNVRISTRAAIYNPEEIEIGDNSRVDDFCVISGKVKIGRNVHIAVFCNVAGGSEGVTLDDFSGLAYGCHVFSQSDDYTGHTLTNPTVPARYKQETRQAVHIGRHCIVGTSSVIFPGVSLGEGTAVGALSVVSKSTQEWSIYLGSPARRIGERVRDLLALEEEYLAETASSKKGLAGE